MIDRPPSRGQLVTVHARRRDGKLSAPLGTVEVVDSSVVILRGVSTLRLPIVVVAQPVAVVESTRSAKPVTVEVVAVHTPERSTSRTKDSGPILALELAAPVLVCSRAAAAARQPASWWCLMFPGLPGCRTA